MLSTAETQSWPESGAATVREILQQPDVWRETSENFELHKDELQAFLAPLLDRPNLRIVLTGAGTSAFAGSIAAPVLARLLDRRVDAIATTDIVSNPRIHFAEDLPTLLVSFARSGNSPESIAATELADEVLSDVSHLILTCNESGKLFAKHTGREKSCVVLMPARADDAGFAMTSSFTSMLLSSLLILGGGNDAAVAALSAGATRALETMQTPARALAAQGFERVVYLGSGPLTGLARESALKLLELTAGKVVSYYDSSLGFRHGPKSVLNDKTLVVVYVSSDPYTRRYDLDIISELQATVPAGSIVVISALPLTLGSGVNTFVFEELSALNDAFLSVAYVTIAQLLALSFSAQLGVTTDNPFPGGNVNRVVKGVQIYPLGDDGESATN